MATVWPYYQNASIFLFLPFMTVLKINASLWQVHAHSTCSPLYKLTSFNSKFCEGAVKLLDGKTIKEAMVQVCSMEIIIGGVKPFGCTQMHRLHYASLALLWLFCIAAVLLLLSVVMLSIYWFGYRKQVMRLGVTALNTGAAICAVLGVVLYAAMAGAAMTDGRQGLLPFANVGISMLRPARTALSSGFGVAVGAAVVTAILPFLSAFGVNKHADSSYSVDWDYEVRRHQY